MDSGTMTSATLVVVLADAPFLALGFLSLTGLSFYAVTGGSRRPATGVHAAALMAALAALLDLVSMLYGDKTPTTSLLLNDPSDLVHGLLVVKHFLLSFSVVLRLIFIYQSLPKTFNVPVERSPHSQDLERTLQVPQNGEKPVDVKLEPNLEGRALDSDQYPSVRRYIPYIAFLMIFVIFVLELTWRLKVLFQSSISSSARSIYDASLSLQLVLVVWFLGEESLNLWLTPVGKRWDTFRRRLGWLSGTVLGFVVVVGALASLGFSEQPVGRLLQGVQFYIFIMSSFIFDFTVDRSTRYSDRWTIVTNPNHRPSFIAISTPRVSTLRISPPTVSTPSPSEIPRLLGYERRPSSMPKLDRGSSVWSALRREGSSRKGLSRSWIPGLSLTRQRTDGEEHRGLRAESVTTDQSSPSPVVEISQPPVLVIRKEETISHPVRQGSRRVYSVVGIKRTVPSPGARLLVLGPDADGVRYPSTRANTLSVYSTPSGVTRESTTSMPSITDMNFPEPPTRQSVMGPSDLEDMFDLPLPVIPAARQEVRYQRPRSVSGAGAYDVTSFIEGGFRGSMVSDGRRRTLGESMLSSHRRSSVPVLFGRRNPQGLSISIPTKASRGNRPNRLSDLQSFSGSLREGDFDSIMTTSPTYSDLREASVRLAFRRPLSVPSPADFNPRPLALPSMPSSRATSRRASRVSHLQVDDPAPMPDSATLPPLGIPANPRPIQRSTTSASDSVSRQKARGNMI